VLYAVDGFFSRTGLSEWGFRWLHILAGITWIGLLYFFNFVQVSAYAEYGDKAEARNIALDKVTRRALWWFRWAALGTFLTGIIIVGLTEHYFDGGLKIAGNSAILTGMLLGTIMMLNVWAVIWRNQKVVLANAANVLAGGEADPNAPAAGRRAMMASRQNTIFSVSMLFFMVYKTHGPYAGSLELSGGKIGTFWIVTIILIGILELNALGFMPWKTAPNKGLNVIYDGKGVRNPLIAAFGLWAIFLILTEIFFKL
jgi:uncharacterized membrane protein